VKQTNAEQIRDFASLYHLRVEMDVAGILGACLLTWPLARWLIRESAGQD